MASSFQNVIINDTGHIRVATGTTPQRSTVVFTTVGSGQSWTAPAGVASVAVLVVAGGGGGGTGTGGGGGGAGGVIYNSSYSVTPGNSYSITVGAGGQGSASGATQATNGSNSVFDSLTAVGGGFGGNESGTAGWRNGNSGGSGGGGTYNGTGGAGTASQGNTGGNGRSGASGGGNTWSGGGGGGAGAVGQAGQVLAGGNGGAGVAYSISGVTTFYGGGGAGSVQSTSGGTVTKGSGGAGGGGDAVADQTGSQTAIGFNGANGLGGGGGGSGDNATSIAGNGGSGIVIVSWKAPAEGDVRYNTTNKKLEIFSGTRNTGNTQAGWTTDGLVFLLDAGDRRSYPGYGNIWYDISGNNRHWYINTPQAPWVSAGASSYFDLPGTNSISGFNNTAFYGPACDTMDFGQEHYIEAVTYVNSAATNWFYHFSCTPKNYPYTSSRLACHFVYGGNSTYYDVHGCCDINSRTVYPNSNRDFVGAVRHAAWRTRTDQLPYRQIFRNGVSVVDSRGGGVADTAIWNRKDPAMIGIAWPGRVYYFAMYNRALTDTERMANFAVLQARYGL
jgi:hypothetical protein